MSSRPLLISSNTKTEVSFNILKDLTVKVRILENPYSIPLNTLFDMAARVNKKRSFLFVSKILGKHLPIKPDLSLLAGAALAVKYAEDVLGKPFPQNERVVNHFLEGLTTDVDMTMSSSKMSRLSTSQQVIFIGFAETATALGHAMFENFENAMFFHTTREIVDNMDSLINFEEEHSHASSHFCYIDRSALENDFPLVLVDDEMTTGKTALNMIKAIHKQFPRKSYTVASLLDWRCEEDVQKYQQLEEVLGITIDTVSLLRGHMMAEGMPMTVDGDDPSVGRSIQGTINHIDLSDMCVPITNYTNIKADSNYLQYTGRFGLNSSDSNQVESMARNIAGRLLDKGIGKKTLCLGTGEFMYLPMKIAANMAGNVSYQSTTRSPIYSTRENDYLIQTKVAFASPENPTITNYFYNVEQGMYDDVFVFFERKHSEEALKPLVNQLAALIPNVNVVTVSQ